MKYKKPIIISGMHRSGTSLIANILNDNGVFIGSKVDENNESIFFQRINKWILSCVGSSWDNPITLSNLNDDDIYLLCNKIKIVLNNRIARSLYFGKYALLSKNTFYNQTSHWLWKDPVNIFTLPVWIKLFPDSKIVNIVRHPLDVSLSIVNRQKKIKKIDRNSLFPNFISFLLPLLSINKGNVLRSFNINSINDALDLYYKYFLQIEDNLSKYDNIYNIRFEDLISDSQIVLKNLFKFLNIHITDECLHIINQNINKNKLYVYKRQKIDYDYRLLEKINY